METWATTVEVMFVLQRYRDYFSQPNYVYTEEDNNLQDRIITSSGRNNYYTSAGIDMIDNLNQRSISYSLPLDRVSGYTIKQLEDALIGAKSWWQWRDNIKNRYQNSTEQYLDELFNNWPN